MPKDTIRKGRDGVNVVFGKGSKTIRQPPMDDSKLSNDCDNAMLLVLFIEYDQKVADAVHEGTVCRMYL